MTWDPDRYLRFAEERSLPFRHLVAAVGSSDPSIVVDLGCGPGELTATLLARWPRARIVGIDSSEKMIERARRKAVPDRLCFEIGEIERWRSPDFIDLMLANSCFHWIEDHRSLFDHLLSQLATDGTLAFQIPANHCEPSHILLRRTCSSPRWRELVDGMPTTSTHGPRWYLDELGSRGLEVKAWRTTYFHVLEGSDPVLEWVRGTTLRPVLEKLPENKHNEFLGEYGNLLRDAYPSRDGTTLFPFRRSFVVASKRLPA